MTIPAWRSTTADDLAAIDLIADQIHPGLPERPEVFGEKFSLFPEGCFVYVTGAEVIGYGVSHPWGLYEIPALDTFLSALPLTPECVFVHDVAILEKGRGFGGAGRYVELIATVANQRNIPHLALVSVYGTTPLWSRFGFNIVREPGLADKLRGYGEDARYMIRDL